MGLFTQVKVKIASKLNLNVIDSKFDEKVILRYSIIWLPNMISPICNI